jgi:hypothetical protein
VDDLEPGRVGEDVDLAQLGKARKDKTIKLIEAGLISYNGSVNDIYTVKVDNVYFNGLGDLYVSFKDINTDDLIDSYEYRNMDSDELY